MPLLKHLDTITGDDELVSWQQAKDGTQIPVSSNRGDHARFVRTSTRAASCKAMVYILSASIENHKPNSWSAGSSTISVNAVRTGMPLLQRLLTTIFYPAQEKLSETNPSSSRRHMTRISSLEYAAHRSKED